MIRRLEIGRDIADLSRIHPWLDEAMSGLEVSDATWNGAHIALEEAVMNVVMHSPARALSVSFDVLDGRPVLEVEDDGAPFDPTVYQSTPRVASSLAELEPGNWGLRLIRHYCRDIRYERRGDRNCLRLQL